MTENPVNTRKPRTSIRQGNFILPSTIKKLIACGCIEVEYVEGMSGATEEAVKYVVKANSIHAQADLGQ